MSGRSLRVGVINLMPNVESYEPLLRAALAPSAGTPPLELCWIALATHAYHSSDAEHLLRHYQTYEQAQASGLDGLILTGAPVEELAFEQVRYWDELRALLAHAKLHVPSTLGLCWGAMALAKLLGVEKQRYARKLFGVYPMRSLVEGGEVSYCAQSRHAGYEDRTLEEHASSDTLELLMHSDQVGYSVFRSADRRFVMHLGHPEYDAERLVFEYVRDRALGRADVAAPHGLDLAAPSQSFRSHGRQFFAAWLETLARERSSAA